MTIIQKAIQFAGVKHQGQVRRGTGLPYILHPIDVSVIFDANKTSKRRDELMCACVLHDTLEDTQTTFVELSIEFSPLVASVVLELTSDEDELRKIGKTAYLTKKMIGMSNYALCIKLCDRLSNVADGPSQKYLASTRQILDDLEAARNLTASQARVTEKIRAYLP
jgi:(p)ppGpp synthase/HD superfamily hydrolase